MPKNRPVSSRSQHMSLTLYVLALQQSFAEELEKFQPTLLQHKELMITLLADEASKHAGITSIRSRHSLMFKQTILMSADVLKHTAILLQSCRR